MPSVICNEPLLNEPLLAQDSEKVRDVLSFERLSSNRICGTFVTLSRGYEGAIISIKLEW